MFDAIFIPLFEAIADDSEVTKIFKNFTFGHPVEAKYPFAFAHIVGEPILTETDDGNIISTKTRLAIRIVGGEKETQNSLEKNFGVIEKAIEKFLQNHPTHFWNFKASEGGLFFDSDQQNNYTQFEKTFLVKYF